MPAIIICILLLLVSLSSANANPTKTSMHSKSGPSSIHHDAAVASNSSSSSKPEQKSASAAVQSPAAIKALRDMHLRLPLDGFDPERIKGSFYEQHGGTMHSASDMLAPRNTPIHAVCTGRIVKLFLSKPGGNTIYQFDPSGKYVFYYAHLEKYAPNLKEGQEAKRGDIIGFVGTSGNAPPNTPHLHFSIERMNADKKWWQTQSSIDPYEIFKK